MSRPRKQDAAKLSRQVIFRMKDTDYEKLEAQAKLVGMSVNQLARLLTCDRSKQLVIETHSRMDPAYLKRLDKLGHNLNQLVKNAHIFKRVSPKVEELCNQIEQVIFEVVYEEVDE